jgi:hypothetical protein
MVQQHETRWRLLEPQGFEPTLGEVKLGHPAWVGFVDWLRSSAGQVIGFRLWLAPQWTSIADRVAERRSVRLLADGVIECAFRDGAIDPERSTDQSFDEVRIFEGREGTMAFAFPEAMLSDAEVAELIGASSTT